MNKTDEKVLRFYYGNNRAFMRIANGMIFMLGLVNLTFKASVTYPDFSKEYYSKFYSVEAGYWDLFFYIWLPETVSFFLAYLLVINILNKVALDFKQMKGKDQVGKLHVKIAKAEYRQRLAICLIAAAAMAYQTYPQENIRLLMAQDLYGFGLVFSTPYFFGNVVLAVIFFWGIPRLKDLVMKL